MQAGEQARDWKPCAYMALAALVAIALMWPGLTGWFLFDDVPNVVSNADIQVNEWSWHAFRQAFWGYHGPIGRPLATLSFALNHAFAGMDPWWFKATNLGIHALNALLIGLLSRSVLRLAGVNTANIDLIAAAIALVWAIHPMQVSSTMYIVQRMEQMVTAFTVISLLSYIKARERQIAGSSLGLAWFGLAAVSAAAALLCKENAILIPLYALALEWTVLSFSAAEPRVERYLRLLHGVAAGIVLIGLVWSCVHFAAGFASRDFTAYERVASQFRVLPMYLYWMAYPSTSNLTFYHDDFAASGGLFSPWTTLAGALFLAAVVWYAVRLRKQRPLSALGIAIFLSAHVLTSSALPLELAFEHRNYFALFGVVLFAADSLRRLAARFDAVPIRFAVGAFVLALAFMTLLRAATWGDPISLAASLARNNPESPRAAFDLAVTYLRYAQFDPASPLYPKAITAFEHAATVRNSSPLPEQALILLANRDGRQIEERWWQSLEHKIANNALGPQEFTAIYALHAAAIKGASLPTDHMQRLFETFLRRYPDHLEMNLVYADFARIVLKDSALEATHRRIATSL